MNERRAVDGPGDEVTEKLRYWGTYWTSMSVGYLLGAAMIALGARFKRPVRLIVRETARAHAVAAADRQGPYMAWVTFVVILAAGTVGGVLLIRWLP